jgi:hypothetical protein
MRHEVKEVTMPVETMDASGGLTGRIAIVERDVNRLSHRVEGNGQPGLEDKIMGAVQAMQNVLTTKIAQVERHANRNMQEGDGLVLNEMKEEKSARKSDNKENADRLMRMGIMDAAGDDSNSRRLLHQRHQQIDEKIVTKVAHAEGRLEAISGERPCALHSGVADETMQGRKIRRLQPVIQLRCERSYRCKPKAKVPDRVMSSFVAKKLDSMAWVGQSKGDAEGRQNPQHRQLHSSEN